jgi:hypothetical protein
MVLTAKTGFVTRYFDLHRDFLAFCAGQWMQSNYKSYRDARPLTVVSHTRQGLPV